MNLDGKSVAVFGDSIAYGSGNNGFGVGEYLNALGYELKYMPLIEAKLLGL